MSTTFQIWIVQLLLSTNSVKKFKEVSLGATKKVVVLCGMYHKVGDPYPP